MDELQRLIDAYRLPASSVAGSKLGLLRRIEHIRDRRVVPFLLGVLSDPCEADDVRIYLMRRLRNGNGLVPSTERSAVAHAISVVLKDEAAEELRLEAALALGEFIQIDGVLSTLGAVVLAQDESIDLRYAAFTSVERAGPILESISLLRVIASDETFGNSARRVLSAWHAE
jgi:hypothetical protein